MNSKRFVDFKFPLVYSVILKHIVVKNVVMMISMMFIRFYVVAMFLSDLQQLVQRRLLIQTFLTHYLF
jgi:hypothetical protein